MFSLATFCSKQRRFVGTCYYSIYCSRLARFFQKYIQLMFVQISKFGRTSTRVTPELKFEELQLRMFKQVVSTIKKPDLATRKIFFAPPFAPPLCHAFLLSEPMGVMYPCNTCDWFMFFCAFQESCSCILRPAARN